LNDRTHVLPHVTHLRVLGGLDTQEGRLRQLGQTTCQLGLAGACWALDQQVFRCYLVSNLIWQVSTSPSIAERAGNGTFGLTLSNDKLVEILYQLLRCEGGFIIFEGAEDTLDACLVFFSLEAVTRVAIEDEVPDAIGGGEEGAEGVRDLTHLII
jgi:hypothetical protein